MRNSKVKFYTENVSERKREKERKGEGGQWEGNRTRGGNDSSNNNKDAGCRFGAQMVGDPSAFGNEPPHSTCLQQLLFYII